MDVLKIHDLREIQMEFSHRLTKFKMYDVRWWSLEFSRKSLINHLQSRWAQVNYAKSLIIFEEKISNSEGSRKIRTVRLEKGLIHKISKVEAQQFKKQFCRNSQQSPFETTTYFVGLRISLL